jgi:dephospho-CoA kinase
MLLGLTGGYCAGKNAAQAILEGRGWTCIDVDKLGHEAMDIARDEIVARFGAGIVSPDGRIDRRALASILFSDPAALADQEAIVHPIAIRLLEERIAAAESAARARGERPLICINAALLHRTDRLASCAAIIEVRAPLRLRVARGMRRDGSGAAPALKRIWRQRGFGKALRAALRGSTPPILVLRNDGSLEELAAAVDAALRSAAAT